MLLQYRFLKKSKNYTRMINKNKLSQINAYKKSIFIRSKKKTVSIKVINVSYTFFKIKNSI